MTTRVSVSGIYHCSLERAFRTPMLCDVSKVHSGFGPMPRVTHCTEDENWGREGYSKKVFVEKSMLNPGGWMSDDKVLKRVENKYWKIEVSNFQTSMLGFSKFVGEWSTTEMETNKILVEYTYTLHSKSRWLYPIDWLFAKTFWIIYMKRVLGNIKNMAEHEEPYQYA